MRRDSSYSSGGKTEDSLGSACVGPPRDDAMAHRTWDHGRRSSSSSSPHHTTPHHTTPHHTTPHHTTPHHTTPHHTTPHHTTLGLPSTTTPPGQRPPARCARRPLAGAPATRGLGSPLGDRPSSIANAGAERQPISPWPMHRSQRAVACSHGPPLQQRPPALRGSPYPPGQCTRQAATTGTER